MQTTYKNKNANLNYKFLIKYFGVLFILIGALQGCYVTQPAYQPVVQREVVPPPWAPAYQNPSQVQYYYMPDIEVYYDVWNHEYIYLENGNWVFEPGLPPMYSGYDLYAGHLVVLNYNVHEPWRHHELYSSHYPKYYYRSGRGDNDERSSGFDENTNQRYYGPRDNSRTPGGNNQRPNTTNTPTPSGSRTGASPQNQPRGNSNTPVNQPRTNSNTSPRENEKPVSRPNQTNTERQEPAPQPRKTQPVNYQEKNVGQPVKVQKNMARPKPAVAAPKNTPEPKQENKR